MIQIKNKKTPPYRDLSQLCKNHYDKLSEFLLTRLKFLKNPSDVNIKINKKTKDGIQDAFNSLPSTEKGEINDFIDYLLIKNPGSLEYANLKDVVMAKPNSFTELFNTFDTNYNLSTRRTINRREVLSKGKLLEKIFNYKTFSSHKGIKSKGNCYYSAFDLLHELDVHSCPYCNRNYINLIESSVNKYKDGSVKRYRPPIDHFYPQCLYPVFSLSFYNLIPSCTFCNSSLKKDKDFNSENYIHPYQEDFGSQTKFKFIPNVNGNGFFGTHFDIKEQNQRKESRIVNSKNAFEIEAVYKIHDEIADEIYKKQLKDNDDHFNSLMSILAEINSSKEEFYQFYFGNYLEHDDFEKRPLAKFTRDLVDDLGILDKISF